MVRDQRRTDLTQQGSGGGGSRGRGREKGELSELPVVSGAGSKGA